MDDAQRRRQALLRQIADPAHTAVLTMELQNGVVGDDSILPMLPAAVRESGMLPVAAGVLRAARAAGARVVHCTVEDRPDLAGFAENCKLFAMVAKRHRERGHGATDVGSRGARVVDELEQQPGDVVVPRSSGISPFTPSNLDLILRNMGIRTVVLTGVSRNLGIIGAAISALDLGYQVIVVRDATVGLPAAFGDQVLEHSIAMIATVVDADELVGLWAAEPAPEAEPPARRFLHLCYCCTDLDAVTDFFVDTLGMRALMRTPLETSDGALLGLDGEIESAASFVYDHRGGRVSPAIEIQSWVDPPVEGTPSVDPFEAGAKSLGFAVADLAAAEARLLAAGGAVVGRGTAPFAGPWVTLTDARGVTIELVEDATVPAGVGRLHHMRVTSTDLAVSIRFYEMLGFTVLESGTFTDAGFLGVEGAVEAVHARLALPDEPFEVYLIEWRSPRTHGRHPAAANHAGLFRMALGVDDTRASYEALRAAGVAFDRPPQSVELKGTPVPDMWIAFLSDPDGVSYEFVQRPRSAFRQSS